MMRALISAVLFGLASLGVAPVALAAQMLVVIDAENSGDSLKPGTMISADAPVKLAPGARVSLLSESGRLVVLSGPYDGKADNKGLIAGTPDAPSVMAKLSKLIAGQQATVATGAARSLGGQGPGKLLPHPSFISVMTSGEKCVLSNWPELWRSDAKTTQVLTLTNARGLESIVVWPAGKDRVDLPDAYVAAGASVTANLAGRSVELHLNIHPGAARNATETFAWMADQGCNEQATALLAALRRKAAGS